MSSPKEIRDTLRSCFSKVTSSDEAVRAQGLATLATLIEEEGELQLHKSHPTNTQSRELLIQVRTAVTQGAKSSAALVGIEFVEAVAMLAQVEFAESSLRFALFSSVLRRVILGVCRACAGGPPASATGSDTSAKESFASHENMMMMISSPLSPEPAGNNNNSNAVATAAAAAAAAALSSSLQSGSASGSSALGHRGRNVVTAAAKVWGSLIDGVRDTTSNAGPAAAIRSVFLEALELLVDGRSAHRLAANILMTEMVLPRVVAVAQQQDVGVTGGVGGSAAVDWRYLFSVLMHATWHPMRDEDPSVRSATAVTLEKALVASQGAIAAMIDAAAVNAAAAVSSTSNFTAAVVGSAPSSPIKNSNNTNSKEGSPSPSPPAAYGGTNSSSSPKKPTGASNTNHNGSSVATSNNSAATAAAIMRNEWIPSLLGVGVALMRDETAPNIVHAALLVNRAVIRAATALNVALPAQQLSAVREFVAQTLRTINSVNPLVRTAVLESLADVAANDAAQFSATCLQPVEEACGQVFRQSPRMDDRSQMFLVLGRLSMTLPALVRVFAPRIIPHIESNLIITALRPVRANIPLPPGGAPVIKPTIFGPTGRERPTPCFAAVKCLAMLADADPAAVRPYILPLADALFCNVPTKDFSEDINSIGRVFPELRFICFDRILSLLREQMDRTNYSSNNSNSMNISNSNQQQQQQQMAATADRLAALDSLLALDFSDFSLLDFLSRDVVPRLTDPSVDVRKAAVTACARLVFSGCRGGRSSTCALEHGTLRHRGKKHIADVNAIIFRLLDVAVADADSSIRLRVIESLTPEFDSLVALQDACRKLVPALNDKFQNRLAALQLMGRLSRRNPAVVAPILRRVMLQCSMELQVFSKSKRQEHAAVLLGTLVETAPNLVAPYISALLGGLVSKLEDPHISETLRTPILNSIAKLTLHVDADTNEHLLERLKHTVIPYVTHRVVRTEARRSAAIRALSSIVRVTGHRAPAVPRRTLFEEYPHLFRALTATLHGGLKDSWAVRHEVLALIGFVGAIDPTRMRPLLTAGGGGDDEGSSGGGGGGGGRGAGGGGAGGKGGGGKGKAGGGGAAGGGGGAAAMLADADAAMVLAMRQHGGGAAGGFGAVGDGAGAGFFTGAAAGLQSLLYGSGGGGTLPGGDEASIIKYVLWLIVNLLHQSSLNDECYQETVNTLAALASMPYDPATGLQATFLDMLGGILPALLENMRTRPTLRAQILQHLCLIVSFLKAGARCVADLLVEIVCMNLESNDPSAVHQALLLLLELRVLNEELQPHLPKLLPLIVGVATMPATKYQVLDCFAQLAPQFANHLHIILACVLDIVSSPHEPLNVRLKAMRTVSCFASQGPTIAEHASSIVHTLCRVLVDYTSATKSYYSAAAASVASGGGAAGSASGGGGIGGSSSSGSGGNNSNNMNNNSLGGPLTGRSKGSGSMNDLASISSGRVGREGSSGASGGGAGGGGGGGASSSAAAGGGGGSSTSGGMVGGVRLSASASEIIKEAVLTLCDVAIALGGVLYQKFAVNVSSIVVRLPDAGFDPLRLSDMVGGSGGYGGGPSSSAAYNSYGGGGGGGPSSSPTATTVLGLFEERIRQRRQRTFDELERTEDFSIHDNRAIASGWRTGLKVAEFLRVMRRSHPDDWATWLKKFRVSLLCTTCSHALHCCYDLAQLHEPFARQLFHCAFRSVAEDPANAGLRVPITEWLTQVLEYGDLEVVQELLNLDEYLGRAGCAALRLDTAMLLKRSSSCKLYAKALRYAEEALAARVLDFESAKLRGTMRPMSQREWETLLGICEQVIRLSNEMGQRESAQGVLSFLQSNYGVLTGRLKERFTLSTEMYANLQWWSESERASVELCARQPHHLHNYTGYMRALDEQGNLAGVLRVWRSLRGKKFSVRELQKHKIADFGAKAAWLLGQWGDLSDAMPAMSEERARDGTLTFYRATSLLHQQKPEAALEEIRLCRQQLDPVASTLIAESYTRAYSLIVSLQQLSELEEMAFLQQKLGSSQEQQLQQQQQQGGGGGGLSPGQGSLPSSGALILSAQLAAAAAAHNSSNGGSGKNGGAGAISINSSNAAKELMRLKDVWAMRLKNMAHLPQEWQGTITNHSLVLDRKSDLASWLRFLRVCHDNGRPSTAEHFLKEILEVNEFTEAIHAVKLPPTMAVLEAIAHLYSTGKRIVAIDSLAHFIARIMPQQQQQLYQQPPPISPASVTGAFSVTSTAVGTSAASSTSNAFAGLEMLLASLPTVNNNNNNSNNNNNANSNNSSAANVTSPASIVAASMGSSKEQKEVAACLSRLALWRAQQISTKQKQDSLFHSSKPLASSSSWNRGDSNNSSNSNTVRKVIEELTLALQLDPQNASIWRQMALFHKSMCTRTHQQFSAASPMAITKSNSVGSAGGKQYSSAQHEREIHVTAAMRGFVYSVHYSVSQGRSGYVQDLLGFLSLWFTNPNSALVNSAVQHELVPAVPIVAWLDVVPQLIARVQTAHTAVRNEVRHILVSIATQHPQALLFPLQVCLNSEQQQQQSTATDAEQQAAAAALAQQQLQQQQGGAAAAAASDSSAQSQHHHYQDTTDPVLRERRAASEEILAKICEIHGEAGRLMRSEAELVAKELTRTAVLWPQTFLHEIGLANTAWEQNATVQQVIDYLLPLKRKMMTPETEAERHFVQENADTLNEALQWMQRCIPVYNEQAMHKAWQSLTQLYVKVAADIKQTTSLLLHYVSPALTEVGRVRPLTVAIPGQYRAVGEFPRIASIDATFKVLSSKARPRRITMNATDGRRYSFLLKGLEDLRQDERVIQLISLTNTLLAANASTSRNEFVVTTMAVVPLSDTAGIIQWIDNCDTLNKIIMEHRRDSAKMRREQDVLREFTDITDAKEDQTADAQLTFCQKLEVFDRSLQQGDGCDLAQFMWVRSPNAEVWLDRRTAYIRSLAVMSMLGYVLGLGDRHPGNMMLHAITNCVVHVDFGDSFEAAILRSQLPEKVPFRLTRLLVRALEVCGVDGLFRHSCDAVMRVLRGERDCLLAVLEAFVHDPLVSWRAKREATTTTNAVEPETTTATTTTTAAPAAAVDTSTSSSARGGGGGGSNKMVGGEAGASTGSPSVPRREGTDGMPSPQTDNPREGDESPSAANNRSNNSGGGGAAGGSPSASQQRGGSTASEGAAGSVILVQSRQSVCASFSIARSGIHGVAGAAGGVGAGTHAAAPSVARAGVSMYRAAVDTQLANTRAQQILVRIQDKLLGMEKAANPTQNNLAPPRLVPRSVPEQVSMLIEEATASENLSQMYRGWCPFF